MMNLPWHTLQSAYGHVAWGMVLAACGVGLISWRRRCPIRLAAAWVMFAFMVCALPGPLSPTYWLRLAFNLPSPLLVACCAMKIWANSKFMDDHRALPKGLAVGLAIGGFLLYADTTGWIHLGLYVRGFGPEASFAGLLLSAAAVLAIVTGMHNGASFAVLLSLMSFALWRLPTGNLWDAVLDPLLWLWACFSLLNRLLSHWRSRRSADRTLQAA